MLEIPRLILVLAMLGIASYHDVRTREIPDYVWIAGCSIGAILYVFDWDDVDYFVVFSILIGGITALLAWRLFPMGDADVLAIIAVTIVYPVSFDMIMTPVAVFFGGLILEHMAAFFYNIRYNIEDIIRGNSMLSKMCNSLPIMMMAFYSVHMRRDHEKFTFCAERVCDGKRMISLRTPAPDLPYESRTGVFVTWAMPAFPFMLAAFVIGVMVSVLFG